MADGIMGNSQMSMYDDKMRLWGLGSDFDTKSLVDMELEMLKLQDKPYENQIKYAEEEIKIWKSLNAVLEEFTNASKALKDLNMSDRKVTMSQTGSVNITAKGGAIDGNYNIAVQNIASRHKVLGKDMGSSTDPLGLTGTVQINGKDLELTADMTLSQIATKVNSGNFGASAIVIEGNLVITSKQTGTAGALQFTDSPSGALQALGIVGADGSIQNTIEEAKDAVFSIDGVQMTSSTNTIADKLAGVTLELVKPTAGSMSVGIEHDEAAIKEKVKRFVDVFNNTMRGINQLTAKGAALQGQSIVNRAKMDMNLGLMFQNDSNVMLFKLGISIDGVSKDGTITYDSTKLDKELRENYDEVMKFVTGPDGFADNLYKKIYEVTKSSGQISGKIDGLNAIIKDNEKTLAKREEQFEIKRQGILQKYARFDIMMGSLNQQLEYMDAQLKGMSGDK